MSVRRGFVCVMLLILPMIYGERCESEDAINICGDVVKTGSLLYLDINIQPKDNIDNCSCLLQFIQSDQDATQQVHFNSLSGPNWCYYPLTIGNPLTTGRFNCGGNTDTLLFTLKYTETLDILLKKETQTTSNITRCVQVFSATNNVSISCNKMIERSPTTTTSNTPMSLSTRQPIDTTSLTSRTGEATTTIKSTTTPALIFSTTAFRSAIPPSSKTSISLMTTNTTSLTALTTGPSTNASTSGTARESTTTPTRIFSTTTLGSTIPPSSKSSTSLMTTNAASFTALTSSSYTGSGETPTETTTLYVAPAGLSDTQVQYIIIGVAAGVVIIIIIVIIIVIYIRKKKREKKPPNVPLEHINPGFTDDESDYGNNTIHNNKNTISDENGHYAVVPGVYDSPIAKVQPLPRDDSAQDNHVTSDDSVIDHYTLADIDTPKTTKQQNTTIGEMEQHRSIPSSLNPKQKSKRQPILPVDVKDLYAVVNKPRREASHEPEQQSQNGVDALYAVPNKPKKQQVADSDTTESKDAIDNKPIIKDNKSALNENTNTLQETSTMDTDIPLNSATDTCTVESTALLPEGITRL